MIVREAIHRVGDLFKTTSYFFVFLPDQGVHRLKILNKGGIRCLEKQN